MEINNPDNEKKNFSDGIPLVISDSNRLVKVESFSNGTTTFRPARAEDTLWQTAGGEYYFYGKNADANAKPYLGFVNESAGRHIAGALGIKFQPTSMAATRDGWKICSQFDWNFLVPLQGLDPSILAISDEDKIANFLSHILLADKNGNAGSVLVHTNRRDISRVDFEQCFGISGEN